MQASKFTTFVELAAQLGVDGEVFALRLKSMFVDPNYQADPVSHKEIKFECLSCQLNYVISVAIEPEQKPSIEMLEVFPEDQMAEGTELVETMPPAKVEVLEAKEDNPVYEMELQPGEKPPIDILQIYPEDKSEEGKELFETVPQAQDQVVEKVFDKPVHQKQGQTQSITTFLFNPGPFQCTFCQRIIKSKDLLRTHMKTHMNYICHYCNASIVGESTILTHFANKHGRGRKCPECHKIIGAKNSFMSHRRLHSGDKLKCKLCPFETLHPRSLKTHQIQHSNEKPQHTCHICGKKTTLRGNLVAHLRNVHKLEDEKTDKRALNFRRPKSETNFCSLCNKHFFTAQQLYRHNYLVHQIKKESFLCESCGKGYSSKQVLELHVRVHHQGRRYNCKFCEATLSDPAALSRHTNTFHTKETSYECHFCSKVFYSKSVIEDHLRFHSGERLQCSFCPRNFRIRGDFLTHKRTKHPTERKNENNKAF